MFKVFRVGIKPDFENQNQDKPKLFFISLITRIRENLILYYQITMVNKKLNEIPLSAHRTRAPSGRVGWFWQITYEHFHEFFSRGLKIRKFPKFLYAQFVIKHERGPPKTSPDEISAILAQRQ